jgi:hypothetical protein
MAELVLSEPIPYHLDFLVAFIRSGILQTAMRRVFPSKTFSHQISQHGPDHNRLQAYRLSYFHQ